MMLPSRVICHHRSPDDVPCEQCVSDLKKHEGLQEQLATVTAERDALKLTSDAYWRMFQTARCELAIAERVIANNAEGFTCPAWTISDWKAEATRQLAPQEPSVTPE